MNLSLFDATGDVNLASSLELQFDRPLFPDFIALFRAELVGDGKALAFDYADASARLEMAQRRAIEKVPCLDWAGRSADEIMPLTFGSR